MTDNSDWFRNKVWLRPGLRPIQLVMEVKRPKRESDHTSLSDTKVYTFIPMYHVRLLDAVLKHWDSKTFTFHQLQKYIDKFRPSSEELRRTVPCQSSIQW